MFSSVVGRDSLLPQPNTGNPFGRRPPIAGRSVSSSDRRTDPSTAAARCTFAPRNSCMSPRSVQRFWGKDMHQIKDLKRVA
ncbi:hypothetical protein EN817_02625 [Mesorhizobium sp. M3A.F.Ca.ET.174.01.1.1]|nr:hypothetical protein EJ074_02890 [Mesorhizobium sp. M3A.F.Ca.ET.080.04.2.1]RWB70944.1 MAG: hypothetical protein EOQ49_16640 [Mesorhizobium sp.]TGS65436.1 hypothetical protein EN844_18690 [Mesorhizobium sp. M3A.F.Ca.ET.201.01.1.1]TGS89268.1 hypothetical protein EN818_02625 [Mesorhizobium sp. M3A.F.Ca.ET.175.01.1.1]TGT31041.1 hypothetical protein EN817_02625 [Mesorhizobium sp. M3A.F.Ca.ET.174.01.1.1]TGT60028.1 hypothetical protein EN813_025990 [Mesorhizobium sp. M00.F.Ca.ET.170.01.1.1]